MSTPQSANPDANYTPSGWEFHQFLIYEYFVIRKISTTLERFRFWWYEIWVARIVQGVQAF
jgi:hypothetical protein